MARPTKLNRPPIVEAIIDISVRFDKGRDPKEFGDFSDVVSAAYPTREAKIAVNLTVVFEKDQSLTETRQSEFEGYLFRSADRTAVAQCKVTGFTFSKLKPYDTWETMLAEAWRVWELYRERYRPAQIVRVATRYINRIEISEPAVDLDDYLTISPKLPPSAPQSVVNFSTAMTIPYPNGTAAVVRCTNQAGGAPGTIGVLLDLDIIRDMMVSPDNDEVVKRTLADLRTIKNELFFDSLTDKCIKMFA